MQGQLLRINVKRFRRGLLFKAHRLVYVSLNSRLECNEEEEEKHGVDLHGRLIRNCHSLEPYSRPIPRALRLSHGRGILL